MCASLRRDLNQAYGEDVSQDRHRWAQLGKAKWHALTPGEKFGSRRAKLHKKLQNLQLETQNCANQHDHAQDGGEDDAQDGGEDAMEYTAAAAADAESLESNPPQGGADFAAEQLLNGSYNNTHWFDVPLYWHMDSITTNEGGGRQDAVAQWHMDSIAKICSPHSGSMDAIAKMAGLTVELLRRSSPSDRLDLAQKLMSGLSTSDNSSRCAPVKEVGQPLQGSYKATVRGDVAFVDQIEARVGGPLPDGSEVPEASL